MTTGPADAGRVIARLEQLYAIGAPQAGADRPAFSAAEQNAHELVRGWLEEAGFAVTVDGAGNLVGRRLGSRPDLPVVWSGSLLDTVPAGGRFDGALGVVGGLEVLACLPPTERTVAVVAFRDEEGWRFGRGFFGSRALTGGLTAFDLDLPDADGVSVAEAMQALGLDPASALRPPPALPGAFVELHIEQGPELERRDAPLAVVSEIVGMAGGEAVFTGTVGHAGTTPMEGRADALCAAAAFVLALRDLAAGEPGAVATAGRISAAPGASNVIPGTARVSVDARSGDGAVLDRLVGGVGCAIADAAAANRCTGELAGAWREEPVPMAARIRDALGAAVRAAGTPLVDLPSGAGHDAAIVAGAGVPTGMLFVRSLAGGISHSPREHTDPADVATALEVLGRALADLALA